MGDDDAIRDQILQFRWTVRPEIVHQLSKMVFHPRGNVSLVCEHVHCVLHQGRNDVVVHCLLSPVEFGARHEVMSISVHCCLTKAAFSGPRASMVLGDCCRCRETEAASLKEISNSELRKSGVGQDSDLPQHLPTVAVPKREISVSSCGEVKEPLCLFLPNKFLGVSINCGSPGGSMK